MLFDVWLVNFVQKGRSWCIILLFATQKSSFASRYIIRRNYDIIYSTAVLYIMALRVSQQAEMDWDMGGSEDNGTPLVSALFKGLSTPQHTDQLPSRHWYFPSVSLNTFSTVGLCTSTPSLTWTTQFFLSLPFSHPILVALYIIMPAKLQGKLPGVGRIPFVVNVQNYPAPREFHAKTGYFHQQTLCRAFITEMYDVLEHYARRRVNRNVLVIHCRHAVETSQTRRSIVAVD